MRTFVARTCLVIGAVGVVACENATCEESRTCPSVPDAGADGKSSIGSGSDGSAGKPATGGSGGGTGGKATGGAGGSGGKSGTDGASTGGTAAQAPDRDAGPDSAVIPPCDETANPSVESCLVTDRYAVFVAAGGSGDGTKASPVGTIIEGIAKAKSLGLWRVIVCNATYDDPVNIDEALPLLGIFGGFHCPGDGGAAWTYQSGVHPVVAPTNAKFALFVGVVKTPVLIQDVDFVRRDATGTGESSIAAFIYASTDVTLNGVNVTAGNGANGANGADGTKGADGKDATDAQQGFAASCANPPSAQFGGIADHTGVCGSHGGTGGTAYTDGDGADGVSGSPFADVITPGKVNKGAGQTASVPVGDGTIGSNGTDGSLPLAGPATGTFTISSFTPASGFAGTDGHTGQGGGGGGASKGSPSCIGASGGAGGMGGCGGTHGEGGTGGGASVALFASLSTVMLDKVTLTASTGGNGGAGGHAGSGGNGKPGASGGDGDSAGGIGAAGTGGRGGSGGNASSGSGGSGGPSYALVSIGTTVTKTHFKSVHANGGAKGVGGSLLGTAGLKPAPDGAQGAAGDELVIP